MTHPKRTHVHESVRAVANKLRAECSSAKAAYDTKATARSEAARITKYSRDCKGQLYVYKCRECDRYHLTSKVQR